LFADGKLTVAFSCFVATKLLNFAERVTCASLLHSITSDSKRTFYTYSLHRIVESLLLTSGLPSWITLSAVNWMFSPYWCSWLAPVVACGYRVYTLAANLRVADVIEIFALYRSTTCKRDNTQSRTVKSQLAKIRKHTRLSSVFSNESLSRYGYCSWRRAWSLSSDKCYSVGVKFHRFFLIHSFIFV